MRVKQRSDSKGSLKWMQSLVATGGLDAAIAEELQLPPSDTIQWRSPLAPDDYAEYRDESFLRLLGLERLDAELASFWPKQGPQWDGLAQTSDGKVLLIEAKAHIPELVSTCAAGIESRVLIEQSLEKAKRHYGAREAADWTTGFYQYANRLAHLQFLTEHGVDAHLIFVYFLNDPDMGRASLAEWAKALDDCHDRLGLVREHSIPRVHSIYANVAEREHPEGNG
jgi:hypothetical protein